MTTTQPLSGAAFNAAHDRGPSGKFERMTQSVGSSLPDAAPSAAQLDIADRAARRDKAFRSMTFVAGREQQDAAAYEATRQESLGLAAAALLESHPNAATMRLQLDDTGLHTAVSLADADGGLLEYTADDDAWTMAQPAPGLTIGDLAASIEPDEITVPEGVITGYGGGPARSFKQGVNNARFYDINLAAAVRTTAPRVPVASAADLPHPFPDAPHPMEKWPEGVQLPASVDFSQSNEYADPSTGVDHVVARITMANGASASARQSRHLSSGAPDPRSSFDKLPQFEFAGDWGPYADAAEELRTVSHTAFEYLAQIQNTTVN